MTDQARRLFYASHPQIVDKAHFATACTLRKEVSVLGCFHHDAGAAYGTIALLDITDPHLDGMEEVTAAHELLHAVWDRMTPGDRATLTTELEAALATVRDQRILDKIESYRRQDPSVVPNELHSVLGTEVAQLTPALETHYRLWFSDRSTIAAFAASSQKVFTEIDGQVRQLDAQLDGLRTQIDTATRSLADALALIEARRSLLDSLRAAGRIAAYNANVVEFNAMVDDYNAQVARQRTLVTRYNTLVALRNGLASQYETIQSTIDTSTLAPTITPR